MPVHYEQTRRLLFPLSEVEGSDERDAATDVAQRSLNKHIATSVESVDDWEDLSTPDGARYGLAMKAPGAGDTVTAQTAVTGNYVPEKAIHEAAARVTTAVPAPSVGVQTRRAAAAPTAGTPSHSGKALLYRHYVLVNSEKRPVYTGPLGGQYYLTTGGNKAYLSSKSLAVYAEPIELPPAVEAMLGSNTARPDAINKVVGTAAPAASGTGATEVKEYVRVWGKETEVFVGPKGGKYYINCNNNKSYIRNQVVYTKEVPSRSNSVTVPVAAAAPVAAPTAAPAASSNNNSRLIDVGEAQATSCRQYVVVSGQKRTVHTGPRGGQYYLTNTGSKVYVGSKQIYTDSV